MAKAQEIETELENEGGEETPQGKKKKDDTLKDFLYKVQKNRDRKDVEAGVLVKEKEERKNILNLKIVVCVDISGSISKEQYNSFMNQLNKIRGMSMVKVIETDTDICAVYDYYKSQHSRVVKLGGGGGTSFINAFTLAQKCNPDAIVFLTDGDDDGQCKKPEVPVAWVVTAHGHAPYDWGKVVAKVDK